MIGNAESLLLFFETSTSRPGQDLWGASVVDSEITTESI
jgi:hypothetical protein